mmetsp:Transcript_13367/g.22572  ORF Transcript_13367/g.22572 Transcript_13367/m.22572 type:complete len:245 (+) Transcript_13367:100-834(+)
MEDLESELGQGVQLPDNIGLQLVLSYCVHNCYTKTAQAIEQSCALTPQRTPNDREERGGSQAGIHTHLDLDDVNYRAPIYNHVLEGNVEEAINLTNKSAPGLLTSRPDVHFDLLTLQFTKFIQDSDVLGALRFAQQHLHRYLKTATTTQERICAEKLQDLITLIAYGDPFVSPVAEFLTPDYRQRVADTVNGSLLSHTHRPSQAPLERLLQHTTATRDRLLTEMGPSAPARFNLRADVKNFCAC